mmetsp:Transcript_109524/g.349424  ORF Transcript_109524/g.349424 Transcript_109524/m.349424 type:complete len:419 (-) Transcript_109524:71-1327(-)
MVRRNPRRTMSMRSAGSTRSTGSAGSGSPRMLQARSAGSKSPRSTRSSKSPRKVDVMFQFCPVYRDAIEKVQLWMNTKFPRSFNFSRVTLAPDTDAFEVTVAGYLVHSRRALSHCSPLECALRKASFERAIGDILEGKVPTIESEEEMRARMKSDAEQYLLRTTVAAIKKEKEAKLQVVEPALGALAGGGGGGGEPRAVGEVRGETASAEVPPLALGALGQVREAPQQQQQQQQQQQKRTTTTSPTSQQWHSQDLPDMLRGEPKMPRLETLVSFGGATPEMLQVADELFPEGIQQEELEEAEVQHRQPEIGEKAVKDREQQEVERAKELERQKLIQKAEAEACNQARLQAQCQAAQLQRAREAAAVEAELGRSKTRAAKEMTARTFGVGSPFSACCRVHAAVAPDDCADELPVLLPGV